MHDCHYELHAAKEMTFDPAVLELYYTIILFITKYFANHTLKPTLNSHTENVNFFVK